MPTSTPAAGSPLYLSSPASSGGLAPPPRGGGIGRGSSPERFSHVSRLHSTWAAVFPQHVPLDSKAGAIAAFRPGDRTPAGSHLPQVGFSRLVYGDLSQTLQGAKSLRETTGDSVAGPVKPEALRGGSG